MLIVMRYKRETDVSPAAKKLVDRLLIFLFGESCIPVRRLRDAFRNHHRGRSDGRL